jgi:LmbE family N-acetylglucosaminyl deacetylase
VPDDQPGGDPVLAVFAHPDDAEIASGGILARWATEGRPVHLLVLTNGDRGSQDPAQDRGVLARVRTAETEAAGKVLGLAGFRILDVHDGELENSWAIRSQIVSEIRMVRPNVVVTCDPSVWFFGDRYFNHADHRIAGATTLDSVFPAAGNPLFFSEQLATGLQPWSVPEVWLSWTTEPNHHQDVTGFLETKMAALGAHRSQVEGDMLGFFEQWLPLEAEEAGRKIGVKHAESFRVLRLE